MRFIPHTEAEKREMMDSLGVSSMEELLHDIPSEARFPGSLDLPPALSEMELEREFDDYAEMNMEQVRRTFFLGAGCYNHFIPAAVDAIISRPEFYTAYTPYQAEASQGTLQAAFEFQSLILRITGMDVANASLYDGATAMAEAAFLSLNVTGRKRILVSRAVHPEYRQVLKTYLSGARGIEIQEIQCVQGVTSPEALRESQDGDVAAIIIQNPNFFGCIESGKILGRLAKDMGALFVVVVNEAISLGLLKAPGSYGADVVAGEGQSLGLPMAFGGPHLGFMAVKERFLRRMPGRLVGRTRDTNGRDGYVLTLQAREQHIRRQSATSNICTNEALCALAATVYLSCLGRQGFRRVAEANIKKSHYAMKKITSIPGFSRAFASPFFNEFAVHCPEDPSSLNKRLLGKRVIGGFDLSRFYPELASAMLFCVTETTPAYAIDHLVETLQAVT